MDVSVVIPAFNAERFIGAALDSVIAQVHRPLEILVVDDGSTDGTARVAKSYGVRLIQQPNAGLAATRNLGGGEAKGDAIAFLDADDVWLPHKLQRQTAALEGEPEAAMTCCGLVEVDVDLEPQRTRVFSPDGNLVERMLRFDTSMVFGGSTVMVRKRVFEALNGYDTRLSTSADWDLFARIAERHKVAIIPEPLVLYRIHGQNMHRNVRLMEHDMQIAMSKLLGNAQPRRRARGLSQLYAVLAGSYLSGGHDYGNALRCAIQSLLHYPPLFGLLLAGRLRRNLQKSAREVA